MTFLSDMNLVRIFNMRRYLVKSKSAIILSKDLCSMLREHPEGCYSITFNIQTKQKVVILLLLKYKLNRRFCFLIRHIPF